MQNFATGATDGNVNDYVAGFEDVAIDVLCSTLLKLTDDNVNDNVAG